MSNLRNSAGFFILVVLVVAVAASLVGIYFPEAAIDILQRGIGSACGVGFLALGGWGLWLVQEKALYGGWQIEIIDPQAKQEFDPRLPKKEALATTPGALPSAAF